MEETFEFSNSNNSLFGDDYSWCGEYTVVKVVNTASNAEVDVMPQALQNSDSARLIGVVPEGTSPELLSDDQLMIAVARGESSALEKLYDRYIRQCFGLALRIVQEPSLAEDTVQEVFIRLWSRPEIFSPERGSFRAWLLTLVRNQGIDNLRRLKIRPTISISPFKAENGDMYTPIDVLADSAPGPHDQTWTREIGGVVRHAVGQLRSSEYQAITLAYFGGLTQQEVANTLSIPLGTVKTRTRSALRRLHQVLADQNALSD